MSETMQLLSFYIVIGFPMLLAYLVVGIDWALQLGTFTCAWWGAWILWQGDA